MTGVTRSVGRWSPATVWLFALAAIAGGAAATWATANASPLATNVSYASVVALAAAAGVFVTRAGAWRGAEAFLTASLAAAAVAYLMERSASAGAMSAMAANENALAQALAAMARIVGVAFGVAFALKSLVLFAVAGLAGAFAGAVVKARVVARRER